ncbi:MAG: transglutaminase domain-containing protein, partial [Oleiphilus sp.]
MSSRVIMDQLSRQDLEGISLITKMRNAQCFLRSIAALTTFFFTFVFYAPNVLAVKQEAEKVIAEQKLEADANLSLTLQNLKNHVSDETTLVQKELAALKKEQENRFWLLDLLFGKQSFPAKEVDQLSDLKDDLAELNESSLASFSVTEQHLKTKKLPESILQRHHQALNHFEDSYQDVQTKISMVEKAENLEEQVKAFDALNAALQKQQFQKNAAPFDPNKLPWGNPKGETREPFTKSQDLQALLKQSFPVRLASVGGYDDSLTPNTAPSAEQLETTLDIQITADIQQLAQALNNDPVEIYSWVHNNIRFIPSYGSIQGADMTLQTKRGNAMDTASLLSALLRASGIHTRYVYGTVEVSSEKAMNWVGGVTVPEAAQQLFSQGGIPNKGIIVNGIHKAIQLEHVWVEAYIDFEPSRGMKHITGDRWIPMDASFKQYDFTEGMDLENQVPFDAQGLIEQITQAATIDEENGWVSGIPQDTIDTQLQAYQQQLEDYINNQNADATVGDVLGLQDIKVRPHAPLSSGLPYERIATKEWFNEVPDNLRHKFRFQLDADQYGTPAFVYEQPTVNIAGKKIALSFSPETQADEDLIASYLPEAPADGSPIDPNDLPDKLPGYLIHMIPELVIDDTIVNTASAVTMGTQLHSSLGLYSPSEGWTTSYNKPIAGEYAAIAIDLQGIASEQLDKVKKELETTQAQIEAEDYSTITKHKLTGNMLYSNVLSYFALNNVQDELAARSADIVTYRAPSLGLFRTQLDPLYQWGVAKEVSFPGMVMDIDQVKTVTISKDFDLDKYRAFNQSQGARYSYMEGLVPQMFFSQEEEPLTGISTISVLEKASQLGQKIITITNEN